MAHLFWLSERQLGRIQTFFPRSRGVNRVDESKVLSGTIHVLRQDYPGWMPHQFMDPTKPSTTVSAAGGIRAPLRCSSRSWHDPTAQGQG